MEKFSVNGVHYPGKYSGHVFEIFCPVLHPGITKTRLFKYTEQFTTKK